MKRLTMRNEKGELEINPKYLKNSHMRMIEKLGEYEDAQESGKMITLPCLPNTDVYEVYENCVHGCKSHDIRKSRLWRFRIFRYEDGRIEVTGDRLDYGSVDSNEFGKTVFLTREEAEASLRESLGK